MANAVKPIVYQGIETLSLRQLDELSAVPKGTSFRAFKRVLGELREGEHFFHLPADEHKELIDALKTAGQIYATTVHLVLLTRSGCARLQQAAS
ncbi:MAG: ORF6N domain-containing protein [Halopseudomonas sp.]|uniref:ORF6N domain-containing protein n=1 Tax=Halopseudomonas sp. TaxID=2901191 RepID=UPI003003207C